MCIAYDWVSDIMLTAGDAQVCLYVNGEVEWYEAHIIANILNCSNVLTNCMQERKWSWLPVEYMEQLRFSEENAVRPNDMMISFFSTVVLLCLPITLHTVLMRIIIYQVEILGLTRNEICIVENNSCLQCQGLFVTIIFAIYFWQCRWRRRLGAVRGSGAGQSTSEYTVGGNDLFVQDILIYWT